MPYCYIELVSGVVAIEINLCKDKKGFLLVLICEL